MATLLLRFPAGRYHATPSGHHVNEGLVEWPPSPWRLLRALIACGYATQGWTEVPPVGRRLIEALSTTLPQYRLPTASVAHSRHFMPTGVLDKGMERKTLVLDTWADVGERPLAVRWNLELDDDARSLFKLLAEHLGYLGRSESWVIAEAIADDAELPSGSDAYPDGEGRRGDRGWEQVSLMAAEPFNTFRAWREQRVAERLEVCPLPSNKKKPSKALERARAAALAPYPTDLVDALQRDTAWWKRHRWSQPPGSRLVLYWRRSDTLGVATPTQTVRTTAESVTSMLLALTSPSGSRSAMPTLARALPQAELLHRELVARVGRGHLIDCPELTGRDATGRPLVGHQHAHLLPVDLDGDGHLDHIVVHAPMGLGPAAQRVLRDITRTWTKGGVGELRVAIAGQGCIDDLRALPTPLDEGISTLLGPGQGARVWTSSAPWVPPRHLKAHGKNSLAGQITTELASRGLPTATVEVLPWDENTRRIRHAVRVRRFPAKPPPVDAGFAIRLEFDRPVRGPISLGYGSHFGLGQFQCRRKSDTQVAP